MRLGSSPGDTVGSSLPNTIGKPDGHVVGSIEKPALGEVLGALLGNSLGLPIGSTEGVVDGPDDKSEPVGPSEGSKEQDGGCPEGVIVLINATGAVGAAEFPVWILEGNVVGSDGSGGCGDTCGISTCGAIA